jgi:hypothetical protein
MCFLIATLALVIALLVGSLIAPQSSNGHRRSEAIASFFEEMRGMIWLILIVILPAPHSIDAISLAREQLRSGSCSRIGLVCGRHRVMLVGDAPMAVHFAQSNGQPEEEPAFRPGAAPHDGDGEGDIFAGCNCKLFDVERL